MIRLFNVVNTTKKQELAARAPLASSFFSRMKGLLGRTELPPGEGLIISPCNSIHTFFMQFPIDVLFVDKTGYIVHASQRMGPYRISGVYFRATCVIELPAGILNATTTVAGDRIELIACSLASEALLA